MKKPNGYWTYERCKEVALKCEHRSELEHKNGSVYRRILKNKWFDLFDHMKRIGNKKMRLIYVYEFDDNYCYIGLTGNIKRRNRQHLGKEIDKKSTVYKHILKTNIIPKLIIKTDYICNNDAVYLEEKILNEYKNNGWKILNQSKTGGLGGNIIKWDKETCKNEAKKYIKISHFMRQSSGAYNSSVKNGWLDEFFPDRKIHHNGYWNNKELCKEEAKKYKTRSLFCYGNWAAYNYSQKNNWLDEFFQKKNKKKRIIKFILFLFINLMFL